MFVERTDHLLRPAGSTVPRSAADPSGGRCTSCRRPADAGLQRPGACEQGCFIAAPSLMESRWSLLGRERHRVRTRTSAAFAVACSQPPGCSWRPGDQLLHLVPTACWASQSCREPMMTSSPLPLQTGSRARDPGPRFHQLLQSLSYHFTSIGSTLLYSTLTAPPTRYGALLPIDNHGLSPV